MKQRNFFDNFTASNYFDNLIFSIQFVHYLNANTSRCIYFPPDKHGVKLAKNTCFILRGTQTQNTNTVKSGFDEVFF